MLGYASSSTPGKPDRNPTRHVILVAEITRVEVAAGLAIIERVGRIRREDRQGAYHRFIHQLSYRYAIVPLLTGDFATAADLTQRHPLKAYDAVQLAIALRYHQFLSQHQVSCTVVSGDGALLGAAQAESLPTENPFDHSLPEDTAEQSTS